jgi:hypothetical protein
LAEFEEGPYDQLVTERLRQSLESQVASGFRSLISALEEIDCPDYLTRHLIGQIKSALRRLPRMIAGGARLSWQTIFSNL